MRVDMLEINVVVVAQTMAKSRAHKAGTTCPTVMIPSASNIMTLLNPFDLIVS